QNCSGAGGTCDHGAASERGKAAWTEKMYSDVGLSAALSFLGYGGRHAEGHSWYGRNRERLSEGVGNGTHLFPGRSRDVPSARDFVGSVEGLWIRNDRIPCGHIQHRPEPLRGGGNGRRE